MSRNNTNMSVKCLKNYLAKFWPEKRLQFYLICSTGCDAAQSHLVAHARLHLRERAHGRERELRKLRGHGRLALLGQVLERVPDEHLDGWTAEKL